MNIFKMGIITLLCIMPLAPLAGCKYQKIEEPKLPNEIADQNTMNEITELSKTTKELTVWTTYWDYEGNIQVLCEKSNDIHDVSLFAAYFEDKELILPDASKRMLKKIRAKETTKDINVYLSVVNDVSKNDITTEKDTDILYELLKEKDNAEKHVDELINLATENDCDGIEIDYEKIRKDMDLWSDFIRFEKILINKSQKAGLKVRIVLEPSTPVKKLKFPKGPEYVVMCYNLYGYGTEPGPKADFNFLSDMYKKFKKLPNVSFAFSNGGFDWTNNSDSPKQLKSSEIKKLIDKYNIKPKRNKKSSGLTFTYKENGITHTVWFADEKTLSDWSSYMNKLARRKLNISLWRL